jgi:hypothetical protein
LIGCDCPGRNREHFSAFEFFDSALPATPLFVGSLLRGVVGIVAKEIEIAKIKFTHSCVWRLVVKGGILETLLGFRPTVLPGAENTTQTTGIE